MKWPFATGANQLELKVAASASRSNEAAARVEQAKEWKQNFRNNHLDIDTLSTKLQQKTPCFNDPQAFHRFLNWSRDLLFKRSNVFRVAVQKVFPV
jgi:hypothetical protein